MLSRIFLKLHHHSLMQNTVVLRRMLLKVMLFSKKMASFSKISKTVKIYSDGQSRMKTNENDSINQLCITSPVICDAG